MIRTMAVVSKNSFPTDVTSLVEPDLLYEFGFEADTIAASISHAGHYQRRNLRPGCGGGKPPPASFSVALFVCRTVG
jgi:hypothetical protein